ncbi:MULTISPECIES: ParA family protein [Falsigemmobacter]|uniref:ParA family protein n=2 Tax=Falsigemmobacter TaxID=2780027 RepID=A0A3S3WD61_9RHOB|nr:MULTISPECIES: ParA family protein [Falsigemmobacter]RRH74457.1 ParA family protein [Falsigemmobacter faecalis]RWY36217.1 ParA family protein [Falsigemmobacter intermedius]
MIISAYTTKGGAAKTTSVVTLLSALAQYNAANPESPLKVLALDLDGVQASLTKFSLLRNTMGRPDYGIVFESYKVTDFDSGMLVERAKTFDIILIDIPGFFDAKTLRTVCLSNVVMVPTNLSVVEFAEANDSLNRLTTLRNELNIPGMQGLFINRTEPVMNMTARFSKVLFQQMLESGHSVYNAKLTRYGVYQQQLDYGAYLFEMEEDGGKGVVKAMLEAAQTLKAVMAFDTVNYDPSKPLTFYLNSLGTEESQNAEEATA